MPELAEPLQALMNPKAYPDNPKVIELVQTQISFVFLAGDYVYKVKKPVNFGFLDFTTLEKRQFYCQQEVVLNKRLCPELYLGVVPITQDGKTFQVEGKGTAIEYAVKMRTLPHERIMEELLEKNQVTNEMVERVAKRLAEFHREAELSQGQAQIGGIENVAKNAEENFEQVKCYVNQTITQNQFDRIGDYTHEFMKKNAKLFAKRVKQGKIRDCHGDLHAAHICFTDGICIFDCIEFNDRFRYIDVACEIAFLAMDLDFHGHSELGKHFAEAYVKVSGDKEIPKLLNFYKCYRAYVRGKVEGFQLNDPNIPVDQKQKKLAVAKKYFELAESYIE